MYNIQNKILLAFTLPIVSILTLVTLLNPNLANASPNTQIIVVNTNDNGSGSLRQAINDANPGDTINFDANLSGQTIVLASQININKSLSISSTVPITISGGDSTRVFKIFSGEITFYNVIIANGNRQIDDNDCGNVYKKCGGGIMIQNNSASVTITNSSFVNNRTAHFGGAIYNRGGNLKIVNSSFIGNATTDNGDGGGIFDYQGMVTMLDSELINNVGCGICSREGTVIIDNSLISGNSGDFGGGICINFGIALIINSKITENSSMGYGGGINNQFSEITVTNSILSNNTAIWGGGINVWIGNLIVANSTLSGNSAIGSSTSSAGGGIYHEHSKIVIDNSTVSGNFSTVYGGGVSASGNSSEDPSGVITITNSTFSANEATIGSGIYSPQGITTTIYNSIVAENIGENCVGQFDNASNNLTDDISCVDFTQVDNVRLDSLKDNGGKGQTHALLPGSPAINAGDNSNCSAEDQRGINRPQNTICDVGAFESRGFDLSLTSGISQSTIINFPFSNPLVLTVRSSFQEPVAGGVITFSAPASGPSLTSSEIVSIISNSGTISESVSANHIIGSYHVSASTNGYFGNALIFNLTNEKPVGINYLPFVTNSP